MRRFLIFVSISALIFSYSIHTHAVESGFHRADLIEALMRLGYQPRAERFADMVERVRPFTADLLFFDRSSDGSLIKKGGASSFVIGHAGLLATSRHVIENDLYGPDTILKVAYGDQIFDARIVSLDPLFDLALLEIDYYFYQLPDFSKNSHLSIGDDIFTIGNALGEYGGSINRGIITAENRTVIAKGDGTSQTLAGVIQNNMTLAKGYSGGALFDERGMIIGMTAAIDTRAAGISFGLPIDYIEQAVDSYLSVGRIERPYLGFRFATLTPALAAMNEMTFHPGAIIVGSRDTAILPGSPAEKANLDLHDIITHINDVPITMDRNILELTMGLSIGERISIRYLRNGKERETLLTVEPLPESL